MHAGPLFGYLLQRLGVFDVVLAVRAIEAYVHGDMSCYVEHCGGTEDSVAALAEMGEFSRAYPNVI